MQAMQACTNRWINGYDALIALSDVGNGYRQSRPGQLQGVKSIKLQLGVFLHHPPPATFYTGVLESKNGGGVWWWCFGWNTTS
jgi:hypothetical protein